MAQELDDDLLKLARSPRALGVLQENSSVELLREVLRMAEKEGNKGFLLDPDLALDVFDALLEDDSPAVDLRELTPSERKILYFMHKDFNNAEIAERLSIAEVTVRYHVHNISKKLRMPRHQLMHLKLPKDKQKGGS
ncbi:MAG TPA: LuxR C-terminal-related transcriptional regulator [Ktedonobacteraceae bacterium]|nr:LuxR C-terminal-related transcriptional regulator [Ktedonobacteraceae bacterium]